MKIYSNAKINLGLSVLNKRKDGFHNIETFFQEISLCDEIDLDTSLSDLVIRTDHKDCPSDYTNLAYKAAKALWQHRGTQSGCSIHISKHIPVGAGLGGGSSNAASVLKALNREWQCRLAAERLELKAAELGSDVPFFLRGGLAFGSGRGEQLSSIEHKPEYTGILIIPPFSISTKTIYGNLNLTNKRKIAKLKGFIDNFYRLDLWKDTLHNDLETVVFNIYPELKEIIDTLYNCGAFFAQMSGSGSAFYGLFKSKTDMVRRCSSGFKRFRKILFEPVYRS